MSCAPRAAGESLSPLKKGCAQPRLHTHLHVCLVASGATGLNQRLQPQLEGEKSKIAAA